MRRLMLALTQTQLGNALGISFQQVQKYEKGTDRISASRLQQISMFLQGRFPFSSRSYRAPAVRSTHAHSQLLPNLSQRPTDYCS
jgi:transcriptional regulator with XRE-family HTH domain